MVFFLVFDILWFVVCAAGVVFTLFVWIIYQIIIKVIEANCHMEAGVCHCTGEKDVPIKGMPVSSYVLFLILFSLL